METRFLKAGDLIECKVKGVRFSAFFRFVDDDGTVHINPGAHWVTWRRVRPRQIVKKLERQERLEVAG